MTLGYRLKALLAEKNISQSELSRQLDVTRTAVNLWTQGKNEPDIDTLKKIASALGVPVSRLIDDDPDVPEGWVKIPIIAKVPAGIPIDAVTEFDGEIMICAARYNPKNHRAFRVIGDSMEPRFHNRDVILVDITAQPNDDDIVVCRVNCYGEVTLKRFFKDNENIILRPDNPKYKPLTFSIPKMQAGESDPINIIGKVVMLLADKF
ncbi:MAG: helix-turn-helix domain-containing protein [Candidatus Riflebacteria bacterium]|nr:helix-turn-helix domain-containing protein [Candidatus Riflebacteria bacterium]